MMDEEEIIPAEHNLTEALLIYKDVCDNLDLNFEDRVQDIIENVKEAD